VYTFPNVLLFGDFGTFIVAIIFSCYFLFLKFFSFFLGALGDFSNLFPACGDFPPFSVLSKSLFLFLYFLGIRCSLAFSKFFSMILLLHRRVLHQLHYGTNQCPRCRIPRPKWRRIFHLPIYCFPI